MRTGAGPPSDSLWHATASLPPFCTPLEGAAQADVAIVGAGYTGLSAALHLAERGRDVIVLDAHDVGWGASGRNGGQVIPGLKADPDALRQLLPAPYCERMIALSGGAADEVFALIARHRIACDASQTGWIQPLAEAGDAAHQRRRIAAWRREGAPIEPLDRGETAALLGTERYLGGLLDRRGGSLQPLSYARGLAAATIAAGARIATGTPVTRLTQRGAGWQLETPAGPVRCAAVGIATNAYASPLSDPVRRSILPVVSAQVASAPLSDNVRRSILPEGHVASDTRRLLLYFRLSPDGRFVVGGRGASLPGAVERRHRALIAAARSLFPQLGDVAFPYRWSGRVGLTRDRLPKLDRIAPGLLAAYGFNGRGIAMATALGRVLANALDGVPDDALPVPVAAPRPFPLHALAGTAASVATTLQALRDRAVR